MIVYSYIAVGTLAGIVIPFLVGMIDGAGDVWKIILLIIGFTLGLVLLHIIVVLAVSLCIDKNKKTDDLDNGTRRFAIITLDLFLHIIGARVHVSGMEKLPREPFMMVCNHRSLFDAVASVVVFGKQKLTFVSKKENINIPFFGRYMVKLGCLFLDREDTRAAVKTINEASELIKTGKASVAICPEGTRNRTEELLLPFHAGSFKIALKAKCPVAVVSIWGAKELKKRLIFKRTDVYIDVVDVIPPETMADLRSNELADKARDIMLRNLERYV